MRVSTFVSFACLVTACGGKPAESPSQAPAPSGAPEAKVEAPAPAPVAPKIPTECASQSGDVCAMPKDFVDRLCDKVRISMALVLFQKGTPWTHGYLTRKTQAWNAEGGATSQGMIDFGEEVLLLKSSIPPKGGMLVSGMGGYQALRWDGSCVTLTSDEIVMRPPTAVKHPRIDVRFIDDGVIEALRKDEKVNAAFLARRKECKGVGVGDVSKKCVELDQKLGDVIVNFVEETGGLPDPAQLP